MSRLLLDEPPLMVVPTLARVVGLNEAIVLQQLHYVLQRDSALVEDDVRWVKLSVEQWQRYFPFWSESTIRRTFGTLRDLGLIATKRGRESSVYSLDYGALEVKLTEADRSDCAPETGQLDQSPCKREGTERETTSGEQIAAPSDDAQVALPGLAAPAAPRPALDVDALVKEVWDYYLATFKDRLRIRELTPPRIRTIQKALKATNNDTSLLKQAINGLKSYRAQHPDRSQDVSMSVIFETGPQDRSNLTEKIEWWAMQGGDQADMPSTVPSGLRARVLELALSVLTMERRPDDPAVRERGEQAALELAKRHNLKVISDGNGRLRAWEVVA